MNDKMNKVKEMDKFLEMYYLTRFNQQEVETMNRQITRILLLLSFHKGSAGSATLSSQQYLALI